MKHDFHRFEILHEDGCSSLSVRWFADGNGARIKSELKGDGSDTIVLNQGELIALRNWLVEKLA